MKYIIHYDDYKVLREILKRDCLENFEKFKIAIDILSDAEKDRIQRIGYNVEEDEISQNPICGYLDIMSIVWTTGGQEKPSFFNYLGITELHDRGITGAGVKIGIIDSGCNILSGADTTINLVRVSYHPEKPDLDDNGAGYTHGTHICYAAGASFSGICPDAEIHSIKTNYSQSSIINCFNYCLSNGIDIINCAWTAPVPYSVLNSVLEAGIIVVAAMGNSAYELISDTRVGTQQNIIAIGGVQGFGENDCNWAFNDYTTKPTLNKIAVTMYSGGVSAPHRLNGTSASSGLVSAYLALCKQKYPDLNQSKAKNLLMRNCVHFSDVTDRVGKDNRIYTYNKESRVVDTLIDYRTGAGGFTGILDQYNFHFKSSNWGTITDAATLKTYLEGKGATNVIVKDFILFNGDLRANITMDTITELDLSNLNITNFLAFAIDNVQKLNLNNNSIQSWNYPVITKSFNGLKLTGNSLPSLVLNIILINLYDTKRNGFTLIVSDVAPTGTASIDNKTFLIDNMGCTIITA